MGRIYGRPSKASVRAPRRLKSEAPLDDQIRFASPSNPDHQRQIRALYGLHPDSPMRFEEDEDEDSEQSNNRMVSTKNHQRFNPCVVDDAIRKHNDIQVTKPVPNISDILASFKPPEKSIAPTVKLELDEEDIVANAALRMPTPGLRGKNNEDTDARAPATAEERREATEITTSNNTGGQQYKTPGQAIRSMFVDLTEEDESRQVARPPSRALTAVRSSSSPIAPPRVSTKPPPLTSSTPAIQAPGRTTIPTLNPAQIEIVDLVETPQHLLQQARDFYLQARIDMPSNITTWADLKVFAAQHPIPTLAPKIIADVQAHVFHSSKIPPTPSLPPVNTLRPTPRIPLPPPQRLVPPAKNSQPHHARTVVPARLRVKVEEPEADQDFEPQVRKDIQVNGRSKSATLREQPPIALATGNVTPVAPIPYQATAVDRSATDLQILRLTEPLGLCPELLPPDAPGGHPHLIQVWDPVLVNLPQEKHNHLDLIDTVVSIIYKYEPKTMTAIKAFLDPEKVGHFFFLFKSRSDKYHSWSIEREGDIITIGIDRNQRAPNVSESERPSAGQYDLTIRYQLQPSMPIAPLSDTETETEIDAPLSSSLTRWTPIGTSIFPAQPPIATFLYATPPNRGADDHEMYEHPPPRSANSLRNYFRSPPTDVIPPDRLSILARYFQTTAFTTQIMDAEFQVCWGHRVRYDAVLGRVRATFRNAIKAAVTQARRREAGEYNRPVAGNGVPSAAAKKGGEKPGTGMTIGHLRGEEATDVKAKMMGGMMMTKKKRTVGEREMEGFIVEDDEVEEGGHREREREKGDENMRKRMKRERVGNGEQSGSEYNTSDESD